MADEGSLKLFPSVLYEDQENAGMENVLLGAPAYSSPKPEVTESVKSLHPLEGNAETGYITTHAQAADAAAEEAGDGGGNGEMKASEWKDEIDAASNIEELEAVEAKYEESGADFATVDAALIKKRASLENDD